MGQFLGSSCSKEHRLRFVRADTNSTVEESFGSSLISNIHELSQMSQMSHRPSNFPYPQVLYEGLLGP